MKKLLILCLIGMVFSINVFKSGDNLMLSIKDTNILLDVYARNGFIEAIRKYEEAPKKQQVLANLLMVDINGRYKDLSIITISYPYPVNLIYDDNVITLSDFELSELKDWLYYTKTEAQVVRKNKPKSLLGAFVTLPFVITETVVNVTGGFISAPFIIVGGTLSLVANILGNII